MTSMLAAWISGTLDNPTENQVDIKVLRQGFVKFDRKNSSRRKG